MLLLRGIPTTPVIKVSAAALPRAASAAKTAFPLFVPPSIQTKSPPAATPVVDLPRAASAAKTNFDISSPVPTVVPPDEVLPSHSFVERFAHQPTSVKLAIIGGVGFGVYALYRVLRRKGGRSAEAPKSG